MKLNRLLANSKDYVDEIIVVDGGSTDDTEKICKMHGAKMYVKKWENNFGVQKNYALTKSTRNWIIFLDDDEFLEYSLWGYLFDIVKNDKGDDICYAISMKNYYRFENYKSPENLLNFPDYHVRFFKKEMKFHEKRIHEGIDTSGYFTENIPIEYGSIIHEKSWEDQKKADIMYRQLENSYN